jgi:hypothetical protein
MFLVTYSAVHVGIRHGTKELWMFRMNLFWRHRPGRNFRKGGGVDLEHLVFLPLLLVFFFNCLEGVSFIKLFVQASHC